jgi:hypothetical protein
VSPNKAKYFPGWSASVSCITKLNEKKTGLSMNRLLITYQCEFGHLGTCPKLWNIGGLFCWFELCQIHAAKLPPPFHQGYSTNFVNSTSDCGLPEFSPNCPKSTSLQVAHCLPKLVLHLISYNNNNNNNFPTQKYTKNTKLLCFRASFVFLAWQVCILQNLWQIPKSN